MTQPPFPPDPNDLTQPIPVVPIPPMPGPPGPPLGGRPPYVHRFGNVPFYVFARFVAFAFDLAGVGFLIATVEFNALDRGVLTFAGRDENGFLTLLGLALAAALVFELLCEALFGTTIGKLIFGLHVRRRDGGHAGIGRVLVRFLIRPIDLLVVGGILALITPRHQRIGDFAAGTVVDRSRMGFFATLLGLGLVALAGYAQVQFAGGLGSALGVSAQAANAAPDVYARIQGFFGIVAARGPVIVPPSAQPLEASPLPQSSDAVANPDPETTTGPETTAEPNGSTGPQPSATME